MKTLRIAQTVALIVTMYAALGTAKAQNLLPDAQDQACWQDLSSLRQCVVTQQQKQADQAARCTSYPEFQCAEPESPSPSATKELTQHKARAKKHDAKLEKTTTPATEARQGQ
jgi:hypothetical protein